MREFSSKSKKSTGLVLWLMSVCIAIVLMVGIGGVTRLTGSGLSITEWKPIMGAIPPLNEAQWQETFDKYQRIPQFQILNKTMDLAGFKWIFFWEYFHRLIGRLIGLIFFIPFFIFWKQGKFTRPLLKKLLFGFLLGGLQGGMGWFMVKSGLSERTSVSHYRLAAHLLLALLIYSYLLTIIFSLRETPKRIIQLTDQLTIRRAKILANLLLGLITLQIFYGALTAGLHAGKMFNTFPLLDSTWIPFHLFQNQMNFFQNIFENPAWVQWIHRFLGTLLVAVSLYGFFGIKCLKRTFLLSLAIQYILGVITLIYAVPIFWGVTHQIFAIAVLTFIIDFFYQIKRM